MNQIDSLRERVFREKPALRKLVETHGDLSLFDYAQRYYHGNSEGFIENRKEDFLNFISRYVESRFGEVKAQQTYNSLNYNYCVSTADHHGPLGHPFFFQSAILRAFAQPQAIIQFCASQVSLGNSSYPRGLIFHGDGTEKSESYLTLPFFASKERMCPVYNFPGYSKHTIGDCTLNRIQQHQENYLISPRQKHFLLTFIDEFVKNEEVLSRKTYSEQITILNQLLWEKLFGNSLTPLICLDAEDMVKELIVKLLQEEGAIYSLICNTEKAPLIEKYFEGISCCFNRATHHGTYLFWYLDEENMRHPLWRDGPVLRDESGLHTVELEPKIISDLLLSHKIIPSGLLVYAIFNCYYGITCFGGFSQGTYLKQMQEAYQKLAIDPEGSEKFKYNQSDILCEDMVFSFLSDGSISTALDMIYTGEHKNLEKLLRNAQNTTIATSIDAMLSEIARCL